MFCLDLRARFDVQKAEVVREADGLREDIERLKRELEDAAVTASEAHDRIGAAKVRADDYHRRLLEAQEVDIRRLVRLTCKSIARKVHRVLAGTVRYGSVRVGTGRYGTGRYRVVRKSQV